MRKWFVVFVLLFITASSDAFAFMQEQDFITNAKEECVYMRDHLGLKMQVDDCAHLLAFRLAHIYEIDANAHIGRK